jgi:hypothetical protein
VFHPLYEQLLDFRLIVTVTVSLTAESWAGRIGLAPRMCFVSARPFVWFELGTYAFHDILFVGTRNACSQKKGYETRSRVWA